MEPWEIFDRGLSRVVPRRRYKKGCKPGVTGKEIMGIETEDEAKWEFPNREYTELEKRKLMGTCLEIGIRTIFELHTYQFGGKLYQQADGGPIGLRITGACAKVMMGVWSVRVKRILEENHVRIWLASGYIDDMRHLTSEIGLGRRWSEKEQKFVFKEEWRQEEEKFGYSKEKKSSIEIGKVMNSIFKEIQFTTEIEEDYKDNRIPTLDFTMWNEKGEEREGETPERRKERQKQKGKILYSFYEKEMGTQFCILETSAMSYNSKRSSLAQEVVRRMLNTSEMVSQEERDTIVEKFILKLKRSGYSESQRKEIVLAGLKGYETKKKRAEVEQKDLHRDGAATAITRMKKKLLAKTTWYKAKQENNKENKNNMKGDKKFREKTKEKDDNKPATAVLFVPRTPEGELATRLREAERELQKFCKSKIRIVEETGDTAKSLVHKANQWAGEDCLREDCLICRSGEHQGDCRRRNIVYQTSCNECKEKGRDTLYLGESARTGYERGVEHLRDAKTKRENSHMFEHQKEEHPEKQEANFKMKIVRGHRSALPRQIQEAVMISNSWNKNLLNSKQEYNRCIIPRLTVMMGDREKITGEGASLGEGEIQEMEENTKSRKRDTRKDFQPKAKRLKRWKREAKVGEGKRSQREKLPEERKAKRMRMCSWRQPLITESVVKEPEKKMELEPSIAKKISSSDGPSVENLQERMGCTMRPSVAKLPEGMGCKMGPSVANLQEEMGCKLGPSVTKLPELLCCTMEPSVAKLPELMICAMGPSVAELPEGMGCTIGPSVEKLSEEMGYKMRPSVANLQEEMSCTMGPSVAKLPERIGYVKNPSVTKPEGMGCMKGPSVAKLQEGMMQN